MFPDYVLVVFVVVSVLYGNPLRVCRVFVNSQTTDVASLLRVHQRFGSYVMNIQAPTLYLTVTRSLVSRRNDQLAGFCIQPLCLLPAFSNAILPLLYCSPWSLLSFYALSSHH